MLDDDELDRGPSVGNYSVISRALEPSINSFGTFGAFVIHKDMSWVSDARPKDLSYI